MHYFGKQFAVAQAESDLHAFMQKVGQSRFPIDPAFVADVLWQTGVVYLNKGELEGEQMAFALLKENKIVVEDSGFETRNRFSTAHEVGHMSLHRYLSKLGEVTENNHKFCEFQANAYASTLLMPRLAVLQHVTENTGMLESDSDKVSMVSDHFLVSRKSAQIKLEELNLIQNPNIRKQVQTYSEEKKTEREGWFAGQ